MQQPHQTESTVKDRLRLALAFAVLECKPEKESVGAFIAKLRLLHRSRLMHPSYHGPPQSDFSLRQILKPSSDHQQLSSEALLGANAQVAVLEPEVRDLKRRLTTAESDLVQNPHSLHHDSTTGASQPSPPAKRTKHIRSVSSHATPVTPIRSPTPRAESSPTTVSEQEICEVAASPLADASASELGGMSCRNKSFGVGRETGAREATRIANDGVENSLLKRLPGRKADDGVEGGCRTAFETLPRDVKLLQTLLLTSSPSASASTRPEAHQTTLAEQSLKVISKLSRVLQLAFTTYRRKTDAQPEHGITQPPSQADGREDRRPESANAAEMVTLVRKLVAQLVPQIMGRLQDEEQMGRVVLAVGKGIIKPCIEAIRTICSDRQRRASQGPEYVDRVERMLECVQSLLDCLSPLAARHNADGRTASDQSSPSLCPFAEVIALCSSEALCAFVQDLIHRQRESGISASGGGGEDFGGGSADMVIATMVQLARGCFERLPWMKKARAEYNDEMGNQEHTASTVRTRVCDRLTNLVASLQLETEIDPADRAEGNTTRQEESPMGQAGAKPLWVRMGMKRESMVAVCALAEHVMIWEYCAESGARLEVTLYDWLEGMVDD